MGNLFIKSKKAKTIFSIVAVMLLFTTWYILRYQAITMTDSIEDEVQINSEMLVEEEPNLDELNIEEVAYPSHSFVSNEIPKITVKADVEEGVFPEGTQMSVTTISSDKKEEIKNKLEDEGNITEENEEVVDILAVDITFTYNGKVIQPKDGTKVNVSILTENEVAGQNHKAIHMEDNGEVEKIEKADVNATEAKLEAESFSIYAIIGTDYQDPDVTPVARYTYVFKVGTSTVSTQIVKNGDHLVEPSVPEAPANKKFDGWRIEGESTNIDFSAAIEREETTDLSGENSIIVNARFVDSYKVVFFYSDETMTSVLQTLTAENGETVSLENEVVADTETTRFLGWYDATDPNKTIITSVTISDRDIELLPLMQTDIIWVYFHTEGGSYIEPISIDIGNNITQPENPSKRGYIFNGWYTEEVGGTLFDFENTAINNTITLYAHWNPGQSLYTIAYMIQDGEDENLYTLHSTETRLGTTGQNISYFTNDSYIDNNFYINGSQAYYIDETKLANAIIDAGPIMPDGSTIITIKCDRVYYVLNYAGVNYPIRWGQDFVDILKKLPTIKNMLTANYEFYFSYNGCGFEWWSYLHNKQLYKKLSEPYTCDGYAGIHIPNKAVISVGYYGYSAPYTYRLRQYIESLEVDNWILYNQIESCNQNPEGHKSPGTIEGFTFKEAKNYQKYQAPFYYYKRTGSVSEFLDFYYSRNKYKIIFNENGGPSLDNIENIYFEADISDKEPDSIYKVGETTKIEDGKNYIFGGWYTDSTAMFEPFLFENQTMPPHDLRLYAKWNPITYNVTFNYNNGEQSEEVTVNEGDIIDKPTNPTKEGYIFIGWKDDNGRIFNFATQIFSDLTLTAQYQSLTDSFTIVYDAGSDGTFTKTDSNYYLDGANTTIIGAPTVTNPNKLFAGWKIGDNDTLYKSGLFTVKASDANSSNVITLTAQYVDKPEQTTIIYNANGGTGTTYTDTILVDNNATKTVLGLLDTGFSASSTLARFICWNTKADGTGQNFYPGETVAVNNTDDLDRTLYAVWRAEIIVNKKDNNNNLINGALFKVTRGAQIIYIGDTASTSAEWLSSYGDIADGTADGILSFNGLQFSTNTVTPEYVYTLEEVIAPDGYYRLETPVQFCITQAEGIHIINLSEVSEYVTLSADGSTISVKNMPHITLPKTGGIGNNIYYIIGLGVMITAGVVVYRRK